MKWCSNAWRPDRCTSGCWGAGTMNVRSAALAGVGALSLLSSVAFVGRASGDEQKVTRTCYPGDSGGDASCELAFRGEIVAGDAQRIEQAIRASPHHVGSMSANSSGGDPFEALKISATLNKYFIGFFAATCVPELPCNLPEVNGGGNCASACALIYLTSDQRFGTEVFLHRPTFPPEMFRQMTAVQAQSEYRKAETTLAAELRQRGVPDSQIELMTSIPSERLQKIERTYPEESPWMEEWLMAKCGSAVREATRIRTSQNRAEAMARVNAVEPCNFKAILTAQRDAQKKR